MDERPTILDIVSTGHGFHFKVVKPDHVVPIMENWQVEGVSVVIDRLSADLLNTVRQFSHAPLTPQGKERIVNLGKALYLQLILTGYGGADRLQAIGKGDSFPLLISTEALNIPWELLHDEGHFLGMKYAVGRQKQTGTPIATPWQADQLRCLLIADPTNNLPDARKEAETLKVWLSQRAIACDALVGDDATLSEVLMRMASGSYNFIHYSGHVFVDSDARSRTHYLVLNDEKLSPAAIGRGIGRNGPVVILNGCDTASVEGLADAFLNSGAQLVVGSMFEVADQGARQWAENFFDGLLSRLPAGEALRLARQKLWESPYAAAGLSFIMYGNPCLKLILQGAPAASAPGVSVPAQKTEAPALTLLDQALQSIQRTRQDFNNACLNVLESAINYAGEEGKVSSGHLFTAILEGPDSRVRDYLSSHDVDPEALQKAFEVMFEFAGNFNKWAADQLNLSNLPMPRRAESKPTVVELSPSVTSILQNAHRSAQKAKRLPATFDDLLAAFMQQPKTSMEEILRSLNIDMLDMARFFGVEMEGGDKPAVNRSRAENLLEGLAKTPPKPAVPKPAVSVSNETPPTSSPFRTRSVGASPAKPAQASPRRVERFADVQFPGTVAKMQWSLLRVQALLQAQGADNVPMSVEMPADGGAAQVLVIVSAPAFETLEKPFQMLAIPPDTDSPALEFHLRSGQIGRHNVRVDFLQANRYIGTVQLDVEVAESAPAMAKKAAPRGQPSFDQAGGPPDLTVLIAHQPVGDGQHRLQFVLHAASAEIGLFHRPVGEVILAHAPDAWLAEVLKDVDSALRSPSAVERKLRNVGQNLWDDLIPDEFKRLYWEFHDRVRSVLLVTDDPWIPWEMIRPYRQNSGGSFEEDDFWCRRFALTRWLRGRSPLPRLPISESRLIGVGLAGVAGLAPLPAVESEIAGVRRVFAANRVHTDVIDPTKDALITLLENGQFNHLHIACHGQASAVGGNLAVIALADDVMQPMEITGRALNFGQYHPLVFFNACETGRLGASLSRLGGWAERFVIAGSSAFIGSLYPVGDESALKFSAAFYSQLFGGATLGDAARVAREQAHAEGDPTWLAYTVYGDPLATLQPEPAAPSRGVGSTQPPQVISRPVGKCAVADLLTVKLDENSFSPAVLDGFCYSIQRAQQLGNGLVESVLCFEGLIALPDGALSQAAERLGVPVANLLQLFSQASDQLGRGRQSLSPETRVRLSSSVSDVLHIAASLAPAGVQITDQDILEAFILHHENGAISILDSISDKTGLFPELLLRGGFLADNVLNVARFSQSALGILDEAVRLAATTHMVGAPQLLAALAALPGSLIRAQFESRGVNVERVIEEQRRGAKLYPHLPVPDVICWDGCSTRARRILNLAELVARLEDSLVEEIHLVKAYFHCHRATGDPRR